MKTVFASKAHNRHVTGVTITNDGKLSLGRERKRMIASLIHQYKIGIIEDEDKYFMQGLLAFSISIEPDFIKRMAVKYSQTLIDGILSLRKE
jgi:RNA-directed DNA polymerase